MTRNLTRLPIGRVGSLGAALVALLIAIPAWGQLPDIKDVPKEPAKAVDDAGNIVDDIRDAAQDPAKKAQDTVKDTAKDARDTAKDAAKDVRGKAQDATKDVRDTAKGAKGAVDDARDTVRGAAKDTRGKVQDTAKDARDTAKRAVEDPRETVRGARDAARDTAKDARDTARDTTRDTRDTVRGARDTARDALDDEPRDTVRGARDTARDTIRDTRDTVRDTQRDLRETVRDPRTSASFRVEDMRSADLGLSFDRASDRGLIISDIAARGPIATLGFRLGDRIILVNGQRIAREADFLRYLFANNVRTQRVPVVVFREGREQTIYIQPSVFIEELQVGRDDPLRQFGIVLDDRHTDRIYVWKVLPNSPAFHANIRGGDILVSFNRQRVEDPDELAQLLQETQSGTITVEVMRELEVNMSRRADRGQPHTTLRPVEQYEGRRIEQYRGASQPMYDRTQSYDRRGIFGGRRR